MVIDFNGVRVECAALGLEDRVARSRRARQAAIRAEAQRRDATRSKARTALTSVLAEPLDADPPSVA